jgi:hypothetical protein
MRARHAQRRSCESALGGAAHAKATCVRVALTGAARPLRPQLYFQCKRGMVDMRTRIRGNKGY